MTVHLVVLIKTKQANKINVVHHNILINNNKKVENIRIACFVQIVIPNPTNKCHGSG